MADNLVFVDEEDIPLFDVDNYDDDSRYDTPDTSRIKETLFTTEQPVVRLRQRLLRDHIIDLCRYLEVDPGNMDLVNPDLFKVKKSKSGAVELRIFNGKTWVSLTNKQTGKFLAKSTLQNTFGSVERMKRILSIEGDNLDRSFTAVKKLQKTNYQLSWRWKIYHCKIS